MSGPKVVKIVTREEIVALCKDHLAQLETALRRWEAAGRRNDLLSDEQVEATRKRVAEIHTLLESDRFVELQKQVPDEIAYLNQDLERRLSEAATRVVAARVYGSRLAAMAQQWLQRDARGEQALSDEVKSELKAVIASDGADRARAEKALSAALVVGQIAQSATRDLTPEQHALAERLKDGERTMSLEEWVKSNLPENETFAFKAEKAIQELSMIAGAGAAAPLADRCRAIAAESPGRRRQMLADTLMLDASKALADAKAKDDQLRKLELESASLASIDAPKAKDLARRIAASLAARDIQAAGQLVKELAILTDEHQRALAAKAQRSAIVTALRQLGYEVRDGMKTGTPHEGTVTFRGVANTEMGVQVSGMHGGGRVQFRPVRFGLSISAGDRRKDRDIETVWCTDFERLKKRIDDKKGILTIEQARTVGEVPVLFIEDSLSQADRRPDVSKPTKSRTLDS